MDAWHIVLGVVAVALAAALVWMFADRSRLSGRLAFRTSQVEEAERALEQQNARSEELGRKVETLTADATRLKTQLEGREEAERQRVEAIESRYRDRERDIERRLKELDAHFQKAFDSAAGRALRSSSEQFFKMAEDAFRKHQQLADASFDKKRETFGRLIEPINETLKKTDERLTKLDESRNRGEAALQQHLKTLSEQSMALNDQTAKLVQSLRAPQVRGRWGEMQLRRVVELAGMVEHCDFTEQLSVASADDSASKLRPDMVVRLPGERCIVVDAKASLAAYLEAIEAESDEARAAALQRHARAMRARVDDLASKAYQKHLKDEGVTPDFAVLFVPGDQFLSAALSNQPDLLEHAASRSIILTTPGTLIALLKAVAFGWSQANLEEDAREIVRLGQDLHNRVRILTDHLSKVGKGLSSAVSSYNDAVGSLERRYLPQARKIAELPGVGDAKPVDRLEPVDATPSAVNDEDLPLLETKPASPERDGATQ